MEVLVNETNDLPEGSIVSIRAGSTRRQAPIPLTEPFRFPHLPFNAKHVKVDIMNTVGTGRLDINTGREVEKYEVPLRMVDGKEAKVGLTVREEPSLCGKRAAELKQFDKNLRGGVGDSTGTLGSVSASPSAPQTPSTGGGDKTKAVLDTRMYSRDHNLAGVVQEMLQFVLRERPDSPYAFMAAYLSRKAQERGEDLSRFMDEAIAGKTALQAGAEAVEDPVDSERLHLEAEHIALRTERAVLLKELAELEAAAIA